MPFEFFVFVFFFNNLFIKIFQTKYNISESMPLTLGIKSLSQTVSEFQNQAPFQFRPCTSPIGAALQCKKVTNPPQHLSKTDVFFPGIKHFF